MLALSRRVAAGLACSWFAARLAAADAPIVAAHRDGRVSADDVVAWSRFVELDRGTASRLSLRQNVDEIVVLRALERRFESAGLGASAEYALKRRQLEWRLAERALRRQLLDAATPAGAELKAAYAERLEHLRQPRRWGLEDIYKAFPEGAGEARKESVREALRGVRARIVAGADFAALAREESESSTRGRGGAMGFVTLERLARPIGQAVAGMQAGDLSPLIELPRGVALVRCVQALEAHVPSFEEARADLETALRTQRFEAAWGEVDARALQDLEPLRKPPTGVPGDDAVVATVRDGARRRDVTRRELRFAQEANGQPLAPETEAQIARELALLEGRAREAERRGLSRSADHELLLRFKDGELRAQLAANDAARALIAEPKEGELRALFDGEPRGFAEPRRRKLRLLKLSIRGAAAAVVDRAKALGRELSLRGGTLEQAAEALRPHAELHDLGWLTDEEAWMLGLNLDAAVRDLKPGGFSPAVQEGPALFILLLESENAERRLSFEEARPYLRARLLDQRRREAGAKLRERLLQEQAVRMVAE